MLSASHLPSFFRALRRADGLNAQRCRVYSLLLLAGFAVLAFCIWLRLGVLAPEAEPLGGDFVSFYAASKLALAGHPGDAWRPALHGLAEDSLFRGPHGYMAFFYPPPYLLICAPLALLPYGVSLAIWAFGTALLGLWMLYLALDKRLPYVSLLAFPAMWIDLGCGQNGALTLGVLCAGFALMPRRPILAGLVLGLMVVKPQLAVALPFALGGAALAQPRYWRTFAATGISATSLCVLAWLAFGSDAYAAFFGNSTYAREALNRGLVDPSLMQSLFAGLRVLHVERFTAYIAQGLLSAAVLALTAFLSYRYRLEGAALGAVTAAATLLATPFMLDYDLTIMALPLGWLVVQGADKGFRDWEKLWLLTAFFLPLISRKFAQDLHLPLAPLVLLALFVLIVRRVTSPANAAAPVITQPAANPC